MPNMRPDQQWPDLSLVYAPDRSLFLTDQGLLQGGVLYAAHAVAALLPDCPIVPVGSGVSHFTLLFAATLLRGQHVLLSSERNPARLAELAQEHNAVCVSVEGDAESALLAGSGLTVPDVLAMPPSAESAAQPCHNPVIKPDTLVALVLPRGAQGNRSGIVNIGVGWLHAA